MTGVYNHLFFLFALFERILVALGTEMSGFLVAMHDRTYGTVLFWIGENLGIISVIDRGTVVRHIVEVFYNIFQ